MGDGSTAEQTIPSTLYEQSIEWLISEFDRRKRELGKKDLKILTEIKEAHEAGNPLTDEQLRTAKEILGRAQEEDLRLLNSLRHTRVWLEYSQFLSSIRFKLASNIALSSFERGRLQRLGQVSKSQFSKGETERRDLKRASQSTSVKMTV